MDGGIFPAHLASGPAPDPHPLSFVPYISDGPQLIVHIDRKNKDWVIKGPGIERPMKWYGHVYVTLAWPAKKEVASMAFGARSVNTGMNEERKIVRLHPDMVGRDVLKENNGLGVRTVAWEMWKRVRGEVCDQTFRYHDTSRIYLLEGERQYRQGRDFIRNWEENPPRYQVVGWGAHNCGTFTTGVMKAVEIKVPLGWRLFPWPGFFDIYIQREAKRAEHRKKSPRENVRNVPAVEVLDRFLRPAAARLECRPIEYHP